MTIAATIADLALEASVIGAHTSIGHDIRRRLDHWGPAAPRDLHGRRYIVTGATSGIGNRVAHALAGAGATVHSASRSPRRAAAAEAGLRSGTGNDDITIDTVDLSRPDEAYDLGRQLATDPIDGIVHAAGAYFSTHTVTDDGIEANAAIYLLGPYSLTAALAPALARAEAPRIVTVTSSGAYAARFRLDRLEPGPDGYRPLAAYARAKRAQIALTHAWQDHFEGAVACQAVTPGWSDTDLLRGGLPHFRAVFGPILRTPAQGADTAIWLAANADPDRPSGRLWRDRRPRTEHRLPWTIPGDDPATLWQWCIQSTGHRYPPPAR